MTTMDAAPADVPSGVVRRAGLVRAAGILMVISAVASAIKSITGLVMEYQYFDDPSGGAGFGALIPLFALVVIEAVPLTVAFVLLAVWSRRPLPSTIFVVLAAAVPVGYVLGFRSDAGPAFEIVNIALSLIAGIFVLAIGLLGRRAGVFFLLAMVLYSLDVVATLTHALSGTLWGDTVAAVMVAAGYALFGIALILLSRSRKSAEPS